MATHDPMGNLGPIWSVVRATLQASRRSAFVLGAGVGGKACAPKSQGGNNRRNFCLSEIPAGSECVMKVMLQKNCKPQEYVDASVARKNVGRRALVGEGVTNIKSRAHQRVLGIACASNFNVLCVATEQVGERRENLMINKEATQPGESRGVGPEGSRGP